MVPGEEEKTDLARCMALSVAIFVGTAREWIPELIERAKNLKITGGFEEGADLSVLFRSSHSIAPLLFPLFLHLNYLL